MDDLSFVFDITDKEAYQSKDTHGRFVFYIFVTLVAFAVWSW